MTNAHNHSGPGQNSARRDHDGLPAKLYRQILHAAPTGIGVVQNRVLAEVNERFCEMLGHDRSELIGQNARICYPSDEEHQKAGGETHAQIAAQGTGTVETRMLHRDGRVLDVLLSSTPLDQDDLSKGLAFTALDVTERRRTETALRMAQTAVDRAADEVYWYRPDGSIAYVNEAACRALGYSRDELLNMSILDIDPDVDENTWKRHWEKLKARKAMLIETRHRTKEGHMYPIEAQINYVEFAGQEYNFAFDRDISERKLAEESVQQSEQLMRDVINASPNSVFVKDRDGRYLLVNEEMARRHGTVPKEMVGRRDVDFASKWLTTPDAIVRFRQIERNVIDNKEPRFNPEDEFTFEDGRRAWFQTTKIPLAVRGDPDCLLGIAVDISFRKAAEENLKKYQSLLLQAERLANVGCWEWDSATDEVFWSDQLYAIYGRDLEDGPPSADEWWNSIHPGDRELVETRVHNAVKRQQDYNVTFRLIRGNDREVRWVEGRGIMLPDTSGEALRMIGITRDVTEQYGIEHELRELNKRLVAEHEALLDKNIALKEVLDHIEVEKSEFKHEICDAVGKLFSPVLDELERNDGRLGTSKIASLGSALDAILRKDIDQYRGNIEKLSPRELDICGLIREGCTSKEISTRFGIATQTVHKHRQFIRKKLQLNNKAVNLASYLRSRP